MGKRMSNGAGREIRRAEWIRDRALAGLELWLSSGRITAREFSERRALILAETDAQTWLGRS